LCAVAAAARLAGAVIMSKIFTRVVVLDFEYEHINPGDLPDPLCMVAYLLDSNLGLVRKIKVWRGELGKHPPFDIGPDTLVAGYNLQAEMTCFQVLGWKFPQHVFCQYTAYLAATNILLPYEPDEKRTRISKRLPDACRAYGIEGWERIEKGTMSRDIGEGRWRDYGQGPVLDYCEEDVKNSAELLRRQLRGRGTWLAQVDVPRILHWSNYAAKSIAQVQARGIPIDMPLWNAVQENREPYIAALLRRFDPSHDDPEPIYTPNGHWQFRRFESFLARDGVLAWPRLPSGQLDTGGDAFRLMFHVPGIEGLYALREALRVINGSKLPIGRDGRNRPVLFPFRTATGRNAHTQSLFNSHAAMRGFIRFPADKLGLYCDWRTQEIAIAAVLSGDEALQEAYARGDFYHSFAFDAGLTREPDAKIWKRNEEDLRQRMKALALGINYGMGVRSLSKGLDRHPVIAGALIEKHRRMYPKFWQWRDEQVNVAMMARLAESIYGWPLHLTVSPNKRTLFNFPMQSGGAEMLRHATLKLCEAGIVPVMLVHDGILFEVDDDEQAQAARDIMHKAGVEVCGGFDVGVSVDKKLVNGERYQDSRPMAVKMWGEMMNTLELVQDKMARA